MKKGRPMGSKPVMLEGKKVFAHPEMRDGKERWFYHGVDITDRIQNAAAAPPAAPAGPGQGQVPGTTAAAPGTQERGPEEEPEKEPGPTITEALEGQLREINSAAQVAKETLKGIEVQLTAIKRKLHEPDIQHRIAVEAEQKRAGVKSRRPMVVTERLVTRKEAGG